MKSRLSYFLIPIIIIIFIFAGVSTWRNKHVKEIPQLNDKSFIAPISSKYIPKNSDLIVHWKINPTILPNYVEDNQDKINKNAIEKKVKIIRDSSFKLISIDFTKDISKWVGSYGSFALFNTKEELINDWLMVLEINKDINIDEEFESILDQKNINEKAITNESSIISTAKIFSKQINSNESIYFSNEKDHIFISSNPEIINSSRNNLEDKALASKEKYKNFKLKGNIKDGILLLEISPKKILNTLGQEKNLLAINQVEKLISSLNIENKKLIIEGILSYDIKNKRSINDISDNLIEIEKKINNFDNFILINNPKEFFREGSIHPYKKLIASIIQKSTKEDYSNLLKIILKNNRGSLIWIRDKQWLALTSKIYTDKQDINDLLAKDKFLNSSLNFKNNNLEVWSKIITANNDEKYEIKENIGAIIEEKEDKYIWSQDISSILNFNKKQNKTSILESNYRESENIDFDEVIRMHLDKEKTEFFLNNFYPYILIRTMLGNKLDFPQSIDLSVAIPTINYPDFVKFTVTLKTS